MPQTGSLPISSIIIPQALVLKVDPGLNANAQTVLGKIALSLIGQTKKI
jgi:hypothetical protein